MWFRNELASNARPVTAYLFSRGPQDDAQAPGDHLGIGGNFQADLIGKLIFFNGNASSQVVAGRTLLTEQSWNHVVLIRAGSHVSVYLNGDPKPEIDTEIPSTTTGDQHVFFGARNDNFAPLQGGLAQVAVFNRALKAEESTQLFFSANQDVNRSVADSAAKAAAVSNAPSSQP